MAVAGVDGARGGWLAVIWTLDGLDAALVPSARELLALPADQLAVDMPVGVAYEGARDCDRAARALLPPERKQSVFAPPRRYMLGRPYAEANVIGKAREGVGLSKQAWHIAARIAELDARLTPADQARVAESHPEVVFHRLNAWAPLPSKRSLDGREARRARLIAAGLPDPGPLLDRFPRRDVKPDDVLDAAACCLTARRRLAGDVARVPATDPIPRDTRGLMMGIWY
jgi:predicted RNase H-like nuclease